jgi:hypothetical protein
MTSHTEIEIIHVIWHGPLTVEEAVVANTNDDYGIYQIYGAHEASGSDTLLYVGQADRGRFDGRIMHHQEKWGRWNPDKLGIYLGRLAGLEPITNDEWGNVIDRAEAVLIWKIGVPFNSARITSLKYLEKPILVVNHGHRHRLPECVSTLTEFINTDQEQFRAFGPSGHSVAPPIPVPRDPAENE